MSIEWMYIIRNFFSYILFSPFIHYEHLHRVAYVIIAHRKWLKIKSVIKSTEFWWYIWYHCIYLWYSKFFKFIIQCEPWNINLCHDWLKYLSPVRNDQVDIRAPNFQDINFHTYHAHLIQKIAISTPKKKLFSESLTNHIKTIELIIWSIPYHRI